MWSPTDSEQPAARKTRARLIGDLENSKPRVEEPERRRAKTRPGKGALEKSWACVRWIAEPLPVLVSYVDSECRHRYSNRAYGSRSGCGREASQGRCVKEMLGETAYRVIEGYIRRGARGTDSRIRGCQ